MVDKYILLVAGLQSLIVLIWNTRSHISPYVITIKSIQSALCCVMEFITNPKKYILG